MRRFGTGVNQLFMVNDGKLNGIAIRKHVISTNAHFRKNSYTKVLGCLLPVSNF